MIPDDGNFPKESRMTISPCQRAPPQEDRSTEVAAQAPLPPDEHKAVRWEGGDRRKTSFAANKLSTEAKKDDVVANVGVPHEEKVDVVHPLQQTVLIRGREGEYVSMRQSDMPSACYLSANLEQ